MFLDRFRRKERTKVRVPAGRGKLVLKIKNETQALPRCDATISDPSALHYRSWKTPGDMQCGNKAAYIIGDEKLCGRHAGTVALKILLGE